MAGSYDFDSAPDRSTSDSVKWGRLPASPAYPEGVLPMWVADMDFPGPPEVAQALAERVQHPVYGYAGRPDGLFAAFIDWMDRWHGSRVDADWLLFCPGIVPAIALAIRAFSAPGEGVVIMPPVYHPFKALIDKNARQCREAPLALREDGYHLDLEALDRACRGARLLLLCSPHNPVGRVWTRAELEAIAETAARHDVLVLSDEIHGDLVFPGQKHLPGHELHPGLNKRLIATWAPSKTFNIAGLQASIILIPDPELRRRFALELEAAAIGQPNCMVAGAAEAAYRYGAPWLSAAMAYIKGNYDYLVNRLAEGLPELSVVPSQGTYLAWLDFRRLAIEGSLHHSLVEKAGLWLDCGERFGTGGAGFARINLGCPRQRLAEAADRLCKAYARD